MCSVLICRSDGVQPHLISIEFMRKTAVKVRPIQKNHQTIMHVYIQVIKFIVSCPIMLKV